MKVGLQKDYVYNKELCKSMRDEMNKENDDHGYINQKKHAKKLKKIITEYPARTNNLSKHKDFQDMKSKVVIEILLHK